MKKLLILIAAIAMFSTATVSAFADETVVTDSNTQNEYRYLQRENCGEDGEFLRVRQQLREDEDCDGECTEANRELRINNAESVNREERQMNEDCDGECTEENREYMRNNSGERGNRNNQAQK